MNRLRALCGLAAIAAGCILGAGLPARGQRAPAIGTPVSATYKGLTTTRGYHPLPMTATGPATQDAPATAPMLSVAPISDALRRSYRIDPFYTRSLTCQGVVIIGSDKVSDWAFLEAAYTLDHMLHDSPPWLREALARNRVRLAIMAVVEYTMDLPESQRDPSNRAPDEQAYQDRRSRGLGSLPWCSCAEENLLNLAGDPYGGPGAGGENITIHEFSHTLANAIEAYQGRNGAFWTTLRKAFADSNAPGGRLEVFNRNRREKVYASNSEQEFWAEGAQAWFNNANPNNSGGLSVREEVKTRDPGLAALLKEIYGDSPWRYIKTTARGRDGAPLRPAAELEHLAGLDALRPQFPRFTFENSPRIIATRNAPAFRPNSASSPATGASGK